MKDTFAQTASKTEQIALCAYLRDGNMKSRTKKIRRLYTGKAKTLCALLAKALPDHPVRVGENGLQVQIETPMLPDSAPFEQAGLALYIVKEKSGKNIVVVSPLPCLLIGWKKPPTPWLPPCTKRKKRRKQSEVNIFTNRDKFGTLAASPIVPTLLGIATMKLQFEGGATTP